MASRTARLGVLGLALLGCAGRGPRYPVQGPLTRDPDLRPAAYPCRPDPKKSDHVICAPEEFESFLYWDLVDKSFFRPVVQFFAVEPGGEAIDVNSIDEVPDSSWFENRAGRRPLTASERALGSCVGEKTLPPEAAPGSWRIDEGKGDGVTPGFRLNIEGFGKFMMKADRVVTPYRASAAEVIGAYLYYAAGFNAPCNFVYALDPATVRLENGLEYTSNLGTKIPFDEAAVANVFEQAGKLPNGRRRMGVSRWLPGRPIGPFTYDGVREDDPLDVVPHEDRRELRGARLMAAWLGHYDAREQNTMATWMSTHPNDTAASPGYVKHWYLDFGDSLGTRTQIDDLSRRYGHTYLFDPSEIFFDFVTLGATLRPWEKATSPNDTFPYYTVSGFDAEDWKPGYPNTAFSRMTERDGAWMARTIAGIDDNFVVGAVRAAQLRPEDDAYLVKTLLGRRDAILRRYLSRLSPIGLLEVAGDFVCGTDLARRSGLFPETQFRYRAWTDPGERAPRTNGSVTENGSRICVRVPRAAGRSRVRLQNGQAPGALEIYLFDEGPGRELHLVGAQRSNP